MAGESTAPIRPFVRRWYKQIASASLGLVICGSRRANLVQLVERDATAARVLREATAQLLRNICTGTTPDARVEGKSGSR